MANHPTEASSDDFFEQILGFPTAAYSGGGAETNLAGSDAANSLSGTSLQAPMMLQLSSGSMDSSSGHLGIGVGLGLGGGGPFHGGFPLGVSLDHGKEGFMKMNEASSVGSNMFRNDAVDIRGSSSSNNLKPGFRGKPMATMVQAVSHPPSIRPRVRARRGQATDPHSIAERLRRERIAERIRALQDLVPSVSKTDRAAMLDEIVDYVKFLRLQVKVLSMSRLGGAGAVAPLVTDIPITPVEEEGSKDGRTEPAWEKWSSDGTERQVAKLMDENVGAAMQFLQSKALCIMPVSLASAIYLTQPQESNHLGQLETKPELHSHIDTK